MRAHGLTASLCVLGLVGCYDDRAPDTNPPAPSMPTTMRPGPPAPQVITQRPQDHTTPGSATPVTPGATGTAWDPTAPLSDPRLHDGIGRAPRRIGVAQLRASLIQTLGLTWTAPRRILTADTATGYVDDPAADMLDVLATTLGAPDYLNFTAESLDPGATFSKLLGDAARKACRDAITQDLARDASRRILLHSATERDTATSNPTAIRQNLSYLALRFWSRTLDPTDDELSPLLRLFTVASTVPAARGPDGTMLPAGTPADGWRAVCIGMVSDPQFLTY